MLPGNIESGRMVPRWFAEARGTSVPDRMLVCVDGMENLDKMRLIHLYELRYWLSHPFHDLSAHLSDALDRSPPDELNATLTIP